MIKKFREVLDAFFALSLGIRLSIGSLLGALGSSTVLGFLTEYATYGYAVAYGARVPTEGVPYLALSVTLISLVLMLTAVGVFVGLFFLLRMVILVVQAHMLGHPDRDPKEIREWPLWKFLGMALLGAFVSTQPFISLRVTFAEELGLPKDLVRTDYLILGGYMVFASFLLRFPQLVKWFVGCFYIGVVSAGIVGMFTPNLYGSFLRGIRFGGGMEIELMKSCEGINSCVPLARGELFLRTKDYFIVRDAGSSVFLEISMNQVVGYSYSGVDRRVHPEAPSNSCINQK